MVLFGELEWDYAILIVLLIITLVYLISLRKSLKKRRHLFFFSAGISFFYLLIGSPLDELSGVSMSTHMLKMSMLYFMVPPLLLLGLPLRFYQLQKVEWVERKILNNHYSLLVFAILFTMYHFPGIAGLVHVNPVYTFIYSAVMMITAFGMWGRMTSPTMKKWLCIGECHHYLKLNKWLLMPACISLLIFSHGISRFADSYSLQSLSELCYPTGSIPGQFLPFSMPFDQELAGVLMIIMHKVSLFMVPLLSDQSKDPIDTKQCFCSPINFK
ncbi:cytochrome c oxidase assembly protein [Alkalihalobacillus sp. TS-13]|uniref:cytochrome c oxidase assembly protein n=1 Tax=Alkalihalobacillus sp. TS-13 TaxID=2842455 RepID=UPI001C86D981|nr:cytochrome c oxidase assembly protein [Alkalihalobacillus sp. TS-13]